MRWFVVGLVCIGLLWVSPASAQRSAITVDGDIRLFTVLSALEASGGNFAPPTSSTASTLRKQVRSAINRDLSPELQGKLKQFYETHVEGVDRASEISKYVSLALTLDQPPKFGFIWSHEKLPPDVLSLVDFEPLLKEFYETVHVERLWSKAQPLIDDLVEQHQRPIMRTIQHTEGYLRLPTSSYLGRHYYIVLDLLGASSAALARNYGEDYYLVVGPTIQPNLDEMRHQFLHFVLDPLSLKFADRFYRKRSLLNLAIKNPNLDPQFKKDFILFATECLIRATELRLRKLSATKAEDEMTRSAASGFFLIRHFYLQLMEFEKGEQGIREGLGDLVESIDLKTEEKYAASLALIEVPPISSVPKKIRTEGEAKLDEAEGLLSEEKYESAKKVFKQVADTDQGLRAKALYGIGVASGLQRNREEAQSYFEQALAVKNVDNATKVWAHIYLGRLHDLEGERESAIREYAAAVDVGDDTRGAQAAAKRGLEKPFQGKDPED